MTNPHTETVRSTVSVSGTGPTATASLAGSIAAGGRVQLTITLDGDSVTEDGTGTLRVEVTGAITGLGANASAELLSWERSTSGGQVDTQGEDGPNTVLIVIGVVALLVVLLTGIMVGRIILSNPDELELDSFAEGDDDDGAAFRADEGQKERVKAEAAADDGAEAKDEDDDAPADDAAAIAAAAATPAADADSKDLSKTGVIELLTPSGPDVKLRQTRSVTDLTLSGADEKPARVVGSVVDLSAAVESKEEEPEPAAEEEAPEEVECEIEAETEPQQARRGPRRDRARFDADPARDDELEEPRRWPRRARVDADPARDDEPEEPRRWPRRARVDADPARDDELEEPRRWPRRARVDADPARDDEPEEPRRWPRRARVDADPARDDEPVEPRRWPRRARVDADPARDDELEELRRWPRRARGAPLPREYQTVRRGPRRKVMGSAPSGLRRQGGGGQERRPAATDDGAEAKDEDGEGTWWFRPAGAEDWDEYRE